MTFAAAAVGMAVYELLKQTLWPDISLWESHTLTVFFSAMIALVAAFYVLRQAEIQNQRLEAELAERVRIDELLRVREEDLRITLNSIGDAVIATNTDGHVTRMNAVAERLTGWTLAEGAGRPLEEVFKIRSETTGATVENPVKKVLRDGIIVGLANHTELVSKSGSVVPIADSAAPIRGPNGICGVVLVFRDQSDERKAEQQLVESEARCRALIEHAPEAIVVLDCDTGKFDDCNTNATMLFGMTRETLLSKGPLELSPPTQPNGRSSAEWAQENIGQALAGKVPAFDWTHRTADGKDFECAVRLIKLPSETRRLVRGSITDVTQLRKLQSHVEQWQKIESIGRLAGGVAHDFNNLLTSITGFAELAGMKSKDPAVTHHLDRILEASHRGAGLTQQLLAFARKKMVTPELLDVNRVLKRMEAMLQRLIGEDIDLSIKPAAELGTVNIDAGSLEQVIMNLAVNARDAMPRGGTLTMETVVEELDADYTAANPEVVPGTYVRLAVSDSGSGMSKETLGRIFEPFFTTKPVGKGTGLGLATCHGIVKQAGGHIAVYSEVGRGTAIKIYLPRHAAAAVSAPAQTAEALQHKAGSETLLVVEDDPLIREYVGELLQGVGYDVIVAADGPKALHKAAAAGRPLHLMLTDVVMPGMSGSQLAEKMVELYPNLIVLYSSGYTNDAIVRHGVLQDNVNFIQKPYNAAALTQRIRKLLDERATALGERSLAGPGGERKD